MSSKPWSRDHTLGSLFSAPPPSGEEPSPDIQPKSLLAQLQPFPWVLPLVTRGKRTLPDFAYPVSACGLHKSLTVVSPTSDAQSALARHQILVISAGSPSAADLHGNLPQHWALLSLLCAFQVLDCLDLSDWGNLILEIMTKHLQSESMERCHLALKGLVVLSQDPSMAKKICSLSERLVELLRNEDTEVVKRSLSVFTNLLLNKDIQTSSSTAPKLAEALRPLFDHDNSHVQQLSIRLYRDVMESVEEKGKQPLKMLVSQSLLPLFFHCHDENQRVAQ
ncbi:hypothetical protein RLOC_00001911, partial [Lonchura striata]